MRRNTPFNNPRHLTADEKRLWEYVTRQDKPLRQNADNRQGLEDNINKPKPPIVHKPIMPSAIPTSLTTNQPLALGAYAGIDRNTAERFRKGHYPLDATLDLHGMTRDKAHMMLSAFIKAHYEKGNRCLLVVTGKGVRKNMQNEQISGILRELLPQWLEASALRPLVLAFDRAKPQHGGSGAYYILLRRKR